MSHRNLILLTFGLLLLGSLLYPDTAPSQKHAGSLTATIESVVVSQDQVEAKALLQAHDKALAPGARMRILGKLLLFDRNLSVNRNEACLFCHSPEAGFTGAVQSLNLGTASYPGSVRNRFSQRKPQSIAYATFAPVLHYNALQGDLVGGNFWDMRATGYRLQSPAAEQAQGPPTNPVEMGLPDSACLAFRISQAPYRFLFEEVWGAEVLRIHWPENAERVCSTPGPATAADPYPVHLSPGDRDRAKQAYDDFGLAAAAYEASSEVSPFTSKYDYAQAGKIQLTAQEKQGYELFRGKARCNECHRDGGPGEEPLFTDFTASNLGVPENTNLRYYSESQPDRDGYRPNPLGHRFLDLGVGAFLRTGSPDKRWVALAGSFDGKIKVPTLRNVDKRPNPSFIKVYMHNGYFRSLKEVVHFYNTRDSLPRCGENDPRERIGCWPAPETSVNLNRKQLGHLALTDGEEDALVSFLKALTDGYPLPTPTR